AALPRSGYLRRKAPAESDGVGCTAPKPERARVRERRDLREHLADRLHRANLTVDRQGDRVHRSARASVAIEAFRHGCPQRHRLRRGARPTVRHREALAEGLRDQAREEVQLTAADRSTTRRHTCHPKIRARSRTDSHAAISDGAATVVVVPHAAPNGPGGTAYCAAPALCHLKSGTLARLLADPSRIVSGSRSHRHSMNRRIDV